MTLRCLRPFLLAALVALPGAGLALAGVDPGPVAMLVAAGLAIFAASFLLTWACEAAEMDLPQAVAVAVVAFIAVLPEYAVDMYFTWMAGQDPAGSYTHYAIANMTGANRLLIGVGWPVVAFLFAIRRRRDILLAPDKRTDLVFLGLATVHALGVTARGSLTLPDGAVFFALYVGYMAIVARRPAEEAEPEGPAAALASLSRPARLRMVALLFAFSALVIVACAEPFSESLVATGRLLGVDEFLLVQWLAPVASEAPEFIVCILFALRGNAAVALGSLLSSKLNQWTLLVGMIPAVFAASSGSTQPMPLDANQFSEIFLTAAQSLFAVALLLGLRLGAGAGCALLGLFLAQFAAPFYAGPLQAALGVELPATAIHDAFSWLYLALGLALAIARRKHLPLLRKGFFVDPS